MNQNFSTFLLKHSYLNLQKLFYNSSSSSACHYDTLKLSRNCTSKQIRDSFIKLSKENHPDINKGPNAHKEFVKIQEAYKVLRKPESRANYDLGLSYPGRHGSYESYGSGQAGYGYGPRYHPPPFGRNPYDDPFFYHNRDRSQDAFYDSKPYYGIKGVNKVSNGTVAFFIISFASMIIIIQILLIRHTLSTQQDVMNKRSMEAQQILNRIKAQAERNGNDVQIEIHRKQFEEMDRLRAEQAEARWT